jgi:formamidopyrimidine-DNA glycosylase
MPELPEVETVAQGVDKRVRGDRIVDVWLGSHKEPFKTAPVRMAKGLEGRTILGVRRVGKHIVVDLGTVRGNSLDKRRGDKSGGARPATAKPDAQWIVHLGMTGRLLVTVPENTVAAHTHARLTLNSGREVRFVDSRRFGRLEFRELKDGEGFDAPGAEPLEIEAAAFVGLFRGRKLAIKAALLNQTLLAGVGNIYADESLFRAKIRPKRRAGRLKKEELERLRIALREVLQRAIKRGGSSVSDYVDAERVRGFFQLEHRVYQRTGEPCADCRTPIRRIVIAGRSTHYCPTCQR